MANVEDVAFHDFGCREEMDAKEMTQVFTEVASIYDQKWKKVNYKEPGYVAEAVAGFYRGKDIQDIRIIDVGAGTGLLAEELWKRGFRNIDGLDPSEGMMKEATKKKVYTNYYLEYMDGQRLENFHTGTYDCLVVSGSFNAGLLPCVALLEMLRLVKTGGLMCFGIPDARFSNVKDYKNRLQPLMTRMEEEGAWSLIDKTHYETLHDHSGSDTIYRYIVKSPGLHLGHIAHQLGLFDKD